MFEDAKLDLKASFLVSHLYLLDLWKAKASVPIQIMHMSFGMGALLGPLIVRPFMLPVMLDLEGDTSNHDVHIQELTPYGPEDVRVHWAFLMIGVSCMGCGLSFMYFYISERGQTKAMDEKSKQLEEEKKPNPSQWKQILLIFIVCLVCHSGMGNVILICGFSFSLLAHERKLISPFHFSKPQPSLRHEIRIAHGEKTCSPLGSIILDSVYFWTR